MADVYNDRRAFFADYGTMTLTVASDTGTTAEVQVAAIKGVTIAPKFEHVSLYGMERVTRAAVAKHSLSVDVSMEVAMWNPDSDAILQGVMLGHNSGTRTDITEELLNDVNYKNKVARFNIAAELIDTDGLRKVVVTASDVYFESVPYEMKEHEFITRNLSGTGKSVSTKLYHKDAVSDQTWTETT
jgi:hypothetical protein